MKDRPTINQRTVIKKTIEKLGKGKLIKKGEILRESGYSEATAGNPQRIYESDGVKNELGSIVDRMIAERDRLLSEAQTRVLTDVRYKEIMDSLDTLTKNIQLLSGKATSREENTLTDEQINELINRRAKTNNAGGQTLHN